MTETVLPWPPCSAPSGQPSFGKSPSATPLVTRAAPAAVASAPVCVRAKGSVPVPRGLEMTHWHPTASGPCPQRVLPLVLGPRGDRGASGPGSSPPWPPRGGCRGLKEHVCTSDTHGHVCTHGEMGCGPAGLAVQCREVGGQRVRADPLEGLTLLGRDPGGFLEEAALGSKGSPPAGLMGTRGALLGRRHVLLVAVGPQGHGVQGRRWRESGGRWEEETEERRGGMRSPQAGGTGGPWGVGRP